MGNHMQRNNAISNRVAGSRFNGLKYLLHAYMPQIARITIRCRYSSPSEKENISNNIATDLSVS